MTPVGVAGVSALRADMLSVQFGGIKAADGLSFSVGKGELIGLIGPNGAGKTTAIRLVTGVYKPSTGSIHLGDLNIGALSIHERARRGLAHTHQIVRPFRGMTVLDNVVLAAGRVHTRRPLEALFSLSRQEEEKRARALLQRIGLTEVASRDCATLPLGLLKRLEMARALALEPSVILLDEPLAGLNSGEAAALSQTIMEINGEGMTVILVEHNLGEVLRIARRLLLLVAGRIVADGEPAVVARSDMMREAYLGADEDGDA